MAKLKKKAAAKKRPVKLKKIPIPTSVYGYQFPYMNELRFFTNLQDLVNRVAGDSEEDYEDEYNFDPGVIEVYEYSLVGKSVVTHQITLSKVKYPSKVK